MPEFLIKVENISKKYRLRPTQKMGWRQNQRILADDIMQVVKGNNRKSGSQKAVPFWALQDISFESHAGDVVGIIGKNGAGKSTLLKILSRVTQPTSGRAIINGRVGSLLEVGTGFHSELTGRENIFISGAIIGMSRTEIKKKFDEIVAFSEVGEFLDTPVKRFSSGMEVRLAFSVAAHLHPEVLLVDEVLSVGDAAFQKKSLNKIREVSDLGGTILFVSHNMTTMASLCNKAMVLEHGKVVFPLGPVPGAIDHYLTLVGEESQYQIDENRISAATAPVKITGFKIVDENGMVMESMISGKPANFVIFYQANKPGKNQGIGFHVQIKTLKGDIVSTLSSAENGGLMILDKESGHVTCRINKLPLATGKFSISLMVEQMGQMVDVVQDAFTGSVDSGGHFERRNAERINMVNIDHDWLI